MLKKNSVEFVSEFFFFCIMTTQMEHLMQSFANHNVHI